VSSSRSNITISHPPIDTPRTRRSLRAQRIDVRSRLRLVLGALAAVLAVIIGVNLPAFAAPAADTSTSSEVVLQAKDAGWVTSRTPDRVRSENFLSATNYEDRSFLKFSGVQLRGKEITTATLVLKVRSTSSTKRGVVVYPTASSWSSKSLTYSTAPSATDVAVSSPSTVPVAGAELRIPVAISAVSTTGDFSFRLQYVQKYIQLMMERSGASAPRLIIGYSHVAATGTSSPAPASSTSTEPKEARPRTSASPTATTVSPSTSATPVPTSTATEKTGGVATVTRTDGQPLVLAHYFVPYPLSLDNQPVASDYYTKNYLSPSGENGKFAAVGGLLRDRPLSPGTSKSKTWQVDNFVTEIKEAKSAGIDGWVLNLMSTSGQNWQATVDMMTAADQVGDFVVVPMVDASSSFVKSAPAAAAKLLEQLYSHESAYEADGKYLLSSFKAEGAPVTWWSQVMNALKSTYHISTTFQAVFLDASDKNMRAYASIADSMGNWGSRTVRNVTNAPDYRAKAAALGKTWISPIAVQDVRFNQNKWAESDNTEAVRAAWKRAIDDKAEYVQLVTWNDYSESTQIAPSRSHGTAFLDLTRYYAQWFHTGKKPEITSDEIVLTHRTQLVTAKPTYAQTKLMGNPTLDGTSTPARDSAEALVWLTAPGKVEITVAGQTKVFSAPAGLTSYDVPLKIGRVSAKVVRDGTTVQSLASPFAVVANPSVQDLQYWAASTW